MHVTQSFLIPKSDQYLVRNKKGMFPKITLALQTNLWKFLKKVPVCHLYYLLQKIKLFTSLALYVIPLSYRGLTKMYRYENVAAKL